jgi:hypothetical protein
MKEKRGTISDKPKICLVVDEESAIVARLDAIAAAEGIARSDVLRRAIRRLLFSLPNVPASENISIISDPTADPITA